MIGEIFLETMGRRAYLCILQVGQSVLGHAFGQPGTGIKLSGWMAAIRAFKSGSAKLLGETFISTFWSIGRMFGTYMMRDSYQLDQLLRAQLV